MGTHDMGSWGPAPIQGALTTCQYCHSPHSGLHGVAPLWSQKLSVETYTLYAGSTNLEQQPLLGSDSNLCLSCHDGTVAPGTTEPYGKIQMRGSMNPQDLIAPNGSLQGVHPFNFKLPLVAADNLLGSLTLSPPTTANPAVKLINGNVQCTSCHEPHVQGIDASNMFLVVDNTNSALCLACHVSTPNQISALKVQRVQIKAASSSIGGGTASGDASYNPFAYWSTSVHAVVNHRVARGAHLGAHRNIRQNGCTSCHTSHNAAPGSGLLRGPTQPVPNMDAATQNCITCHNGGSNISPAIPNVYAEFAKTGHPFPTGSNQHTVGEDAVLNKSRHATCVDCHDPHAATESGSFATTTIRGAQRGAIGVSAADGITKVVPAKYQYETCLRCHGTSQGKQVLSIYGYLPTRAVTSGDPLNVIPQFNTNAKSSHPVMHDRSSPLPQPSLRKFMLNLDGHTNGRAMGTRILCTDCHNSDDNREFGGSGANGPHGSIYSHILERRYEFSQVAPGTGPSAGPGTTIQNLLPVVVDPAANGPYSLCAKCHDLTNILEDRSFSKHSLHIKAGFSCSVCHTAHGLPASSGISGERLVNFDIAVVAPNDQTNAPISYDYGTGTCTLKCHNYNHNANGTVTPAGVQNLVAPIKVAAPVKR
jgi:predicted CXXCH cytochrome family protein